MTCGNLRNHYLVRQNKKDVKSFFEEEYDHYDENVIMISKGSILISTWEQKILTDFLKGQYFDNALDIGAGTGRITQLVLRHADHIVALDISLNMLKKLHKKLKSDKLSLVLADTEHLPFRPSCFQVLVCMRTLKYLKNLEDVLSEFATVSDANSLIAFEFANFLSYLRLFRKWDGFDLSLTNPQQVSEILFNKGFQTINLEGNFRIPYAIYARVNNFVLLKIFFCMEALLAKIFPKHIAIRDFIYIGKKARLLR